MSQDIKSHSNYKWKYRYSGLRNVKVHFREVYNLIKSKYFKGIFTLCYKNQWDMLGKYKRCNNIRNKNEIVVNFRIHIVVSNNNMYLLEKLKTYF